MNFTETNHKKRIAEMFGLRSSFQISQYQNAAAIFLIDFKRSTKLCPLQRREKSLIQFPLAKAHNYSLDFVGTDLFPYPKSYRKALSCRAHQVLSEKRLFDKALSVSPIQRKGNPL